MTMSREAVAVDGGEIPRDARARAEGRSIGGSGGKAGSLFATAGFGLSGAAFTIGMLMLARALPVEAYGRFTLAIAMFNVFGLLTPLGVDQLLLRQRIDPGPRFLAFLLGAGTVMGALVALIVVGIGGLRPMEGFWMAVAVCAGGIVSTTNLGLRVHHQPVRSMALATAASFILLVAGVAAVPLGIRDPAAPLAFFALGNAVCAGLGWRALSSGYRVPPADRDSILWKEAFSFFGIVALGSISLQIERLIIPVPLGMQELAVFAVLAAVAIFPFRLLAAGVSFTLAPRLRHAADLRACYRAVRAEIVLLTFISVAGSATLSLLGPWAARIIAGDQYRIGVGLMLAACFNGVTKVIMAIPRAIVTACGSTRDIVRLNSFGLLWLAAVIGGAVLGARYGLEGLLWTASLGGLVAQLPSIMLARNCLERSGRT
ncbi:MAG: polysaccharide biosynthesis protein [Sphingobium sp.]